MEDLRIRKYLSWNQKIRVVDLKLFTPEYKQERNFFLQNFSSKIIYEQNVNVLINRTQGGDVVEGLKIINDFTLFFSRYLFFLF